MEELVVMTRATMMNKRLDRATKRIDSIGLRVKEGLFEIAAIIADVDAQRDYEEDGYASVHDWTAQQFGLAKSRSYELLTIGREWAAAKVNTKGAVVGFVCSIDAGYSTTQVGKMLPAGKALAEELHDAGKISPAMTAKEIGKVISEERKRRKAEEDAAEEEEEDAAEEEEDAAEETEAPSEICATLVMLSVLENGTEVPVMTQRYRIPVDVLQQYKVTD